MASFCQSQQRVRRAAFETNLRLESGQTARRVVRRPRGVWSSSNGWLASAPMLHGGARCPTWFWDDTRPAALPIPASDCRNAAPPGSSARGWFCERWISSRSKSKSPPDASKISDLQLSERPAAYRCRKWQRRRAFDMLWRRGDRRAPAFPDQLAVHALPRHSAWFTSRPQQRSPALVSRRRRPTHREAPSSRSRSRICRDRAG